MHFSIPDTQELKDEGGATYMCFNVHINGAFHCTVRYRQLHHFHEQLKKEFGSSNLPVFPPKKLLHLTPVQLEERRAMLERYIQIVSQEASIAGSEAFNGFLSSAQQETAHESAEEASLDVYLMNGHKISINIQSTDQTEDILEIAATQIELPEDYVYYFGLFLVKKEEDGDNSIVRRLQDFESPFISLRNCQKDGAVYRIVLRKSYWDPSFDDDLLDNRISMNLLYVQAVSDIERQWTVATKDQLRQLIALQKKNSKRQYLQFARTLKYYGSLQYRPCFTDYPQANTRVIISAANKELVFRLQLAENQLKEGSFRITRMRCWRITTLLNGKDDAEKQNGQNSSCNGGTEEPDPKLELAFEYLVSRENLKWIAIQSDQAILMSMCLQGMVDELIMKKQGKKFKKPSDRVRTNKYNYLKRNVAASSMPIIHKQANSVTTPDEPEQRSSKPTPSVHHDPQVEDQGAINKAVDSMKKISDKFSNVSVKSGKARSAPVDKACTENDAFEGIGDDDL